MPPNTTLHFHCISHVCLLVLLLFSTASALPATKRDARFTFFPLPDALSGPCDLADGPDGALWGQDILLNDIFRIEPSTGRVDTYPIPFTTPLNNATLPANVTQLIQDRTALSCAIRAGADGNLYAANGVRNQLIRINPTSKAMKIFEPTPPVNPLGNLQPFNDLYSSATGIYSTQTTGNTFQFFSFATELFTTYTVPTPLAIPLGVFVASDEKVYIAELLGNAILVFTPSTGEIEEFPLPEPAQLPAVIRAEREGWVYFSLVTGAGLGRIAMDGTHAIELFHTNQTAGLGAEDTIDPYGGVWLSFFTVDALARLDTKTLEYEYVAFPETVAAVVGGEGILGDLPPAVDVAVNYGPGKAVWFTDVSGNRVGRYEISGLY